MSEQTSFDKRAPLTLEQKRAWDAWIVDGAIAFALARAGIVEDRADAAMNVVRPQFVVDSGQAKHGESGAHAPAWVDVVLKRERPEWFGSERTLAEAQPIALRLSRPARERYERARNGGEA